MKSFLVTLMIMSSNVQAIELIPTIEGQSQTAIIKVQTIQDDISKNALSATCFNLGSLKSTLSDLTTLSFSLLEEHAEGKKVLQVAGQAKVLADSTIGFCTEDASDTYSGNGLTVEKVKFQNVKALKKRLTNIEQKVNETDLIIRTSF
ncbi:hypothetical protein [Halobacteriovorax sp. HLS]|uniref:hypothetical protein n=1 Tax=Halobacteriovorax sp. HLS TaxID=2234000 RepID=UPI000FD8977E|nr:hypothetical protein [Halobacteriovorax sp. HLS]